MGDPMSVLPCGLSGLTAEGLRMSRDPVAVRLRGWPGGSPLGWDVRLPPPLAARASETCACRGGGVCPRPLGRDAGSRTPESQRSAGTARGGLVEIVSSSGSRFP